MLREKKLTKLVKTFQPNGNNKFMTMSTVDATPISEVNTWNEYPFPFLHKKSVKFLDTTPTAQGSSIITLSKSWRFVIQF
jgi:hypothetical protein